MPELSRLLPPLLAATVISAIPPAYASDAAEPAGNPTVTCASRPGERIHCPADTSAGVALVKSTGESACLLGKTWGYDDAGIWVSDGCTGEFVVGRATQEPAEKETKVSRTDPDAGYMVRDGKPKGFFYLDHRTVDGQLGIITDTHTTPANVHDSIVYLGRLDRQRERFGFDVGAVGLDAGYATSGIAKGLEERSILGVTGYRRPTPPRPGMMPPKAFTYEAHVDGYRCPQGQLLAYARTDRTGYRHYKSNPVICRTCPLLASCTSSANATRLITRHVWADTRERTDAHRLTPLASASTNGARRRSSARLPTPSNSTATATRASAGCSPYPASACSPPPPRTSRRSPWRWRPKPQWREGNALFVNPAKQNPAETTGFVSSLRLRQLPEPSGFKLARSYWQGCRRPS